MNKGDRETIFGMLIWSGVYLMCGVAVHQIFFWWHGV